MVVTNWKKEVARDLMALGSMPFVILVLVRILLVSNYEEMFHIIVAIILLGVISIKIRDLHHHSARIIILAIFTSIFYASYLYAVFAFLTAVLAVYGTKTYLKKKKVYLSLVLGIICSILSYLIEIPLQIQNL